MNPPKLRSVPIQTSNRHPHTHLSARKPPKQGEERRAVSRSRHEEEEEEVKKKKRETKIPKPVRERYLVDPNCWNDGEQRTG